MIEQLKKNIDSEIEILREIAHYSALLPGAEPAEQRLLSASIDSLRKSMKMINNSLPSILNSISLAKKLPAKNSKLPIEKVNFKRGGNEVNVVLLSTDKEKFIKELSINEETLKKIKRVAYQLPEKKQEFQGSRGYVKFSNKIFINLASKLVRKGYFKPLALDIKKGNLDILVESYVAMALFTTLLSIGVAIVLMIFLLFFSISINFPFLGIYEGDKITRFVKLLWMPIIVPLLTFLAFYFYPSSEKDTIEKKIDQELPFAVIHMSAISGSGIEPTNIFKIIALSKEYPYLRKELRKVLNQINLYGYDLVTALNNVARNTPSSKLSEIFTGISTTIGSGGDLSEFFEKRAETLLMNYRLEREKFTRVAETFMDIYITIAIAAPMLMLLVLVILSISSFDIGMSPSMMTFSIIMLLAVINIGFISLLQAKQPAY